MLTKIVIVLIRVYQKTLSPDDGLLAAWYPQGYCRFQPHCSEYAILAFQQHGLIKGLWLSLKRLARCHPWQQPKIDYPQ